MNATRSFVSTHRWILLIVATVVVALGVLVIAYLAFEDARSGFGSALVGGAIEIVFVGLLGGILAAAIKEETGRQEESRRIQADALAQKRREQAERLAQLRRDQVAALQEEQRLNQERLRVLLDVVTAYHMVKAVRRALRAAGFNTSPTSFEQWQIEEFRSQMAVLSTAELAVEKTNRELRANVGLLTRLDGITDALKGVEDYLVTIIQEWESQTVRLSTQSVEIKTALPQLAGFLAGKEEGSNATFPRFVSSRMRFVHDCIRLDIATKSMDPARDLPEPEEFDPAPAAS